MQPHRVYSQLHKRSKPLDQLEDCLIQLAIENSYRLLFEGSKSEFEIEVHPTFASRMVTRKSLNSCMQVLQLPQQQVSGPLACFWSTT